MLRKYNKTLTVALTAIALATAPSLRPATPLPAAAGRVAVAAREVAAAVGATIIIGFGGLYVGGGGTCWVWVRGALINICY
jgi:hypothetical protein